MGNGSRLASWNADQWYNFDCIYPAAGEEPAHKGQYVVCAMELLQKAVQAGWKDADQVANDPHLNALRNRADFQPLIETMRANVLN